ncbi:MAG: flagellar basal-body MS-ring/collar protein FliF [Pseudomonadota bacterium]
MDGTANIAELPVAQAPQIQLSTVLKIPAVRQILSLVGVAASVAMGIAIFMWSQSPDYKQLYSGLEQSDRAAVADALRTSGLDFEIDVASGAIMVRAEDMHNARMQLASQGLPRASAGGMESMNDQSSFGVSQFMESARYQHAQEAELSRTIKSLRSVKDARVHLAMPKQSAFIRDQQRPSASVVLQLYGGQKLEAEQAMSIVNLVAGSIPGMRPSEVTLVDQFGRYLSESDTMTDEVLTAAQFKITAAREAEFKQKIEKMLTPMLGIGNMRSAVTLDLDFTITEQTTESYDPASQVVRSERVTQQQQKGQDAQNGGIPGALANTPPEAGGGAALEDGVPDTTVNTSSDETRNYEVDKTVSRTRAPTGNIRRISVAVLVDEAALFADVAQSDAAEATGDAAEDAVAAEPAVVEPEIDLARVEALVREAIGFDAARGDTVEVQSAPFKAPPELAEIDGPPIWENPMVREIAKQGAGVLLALALAFGIIRPMLKSIVEPPPGSLATLLPGQVQGAQPVTGQLDGPGESGGALTYQEKVTAARNITGHDPARVAQVVRKWIDTDAG